MRIIRTHQHLKHCLAKLIIHCLNHPLKKVPFLKTPFPTSPLPHCHETRGKSNSIRPFVRFPLLPYHITLAVTSPLNPACSLACVALKFVPGRGTRLDSESDGDSRQREKSNEDDYWILDRHSGDQRRGDRARPVRFGRQTSWSPRNSDICAHFDAKGTDFWSTESWLVGDLIQRSAKKVCKFCWAGKQEQEQTSRNHVPSF